MQFQETRSDELEVGMRVRSATGTQYRVNYAKPQRDGSVLVILQRDEEGTLPQQPRYAVASDTWLARQATVAETATDPEKYARRA